MHKLEFNFGELSFNKFFPFFILIDPNLSIQGIGKSLAKIAPQIQITDSFFNHFSIVRPYLEELSYTTLVENQNQLIILKLKNDEIVLRGQLESLDQNLLFVGTPWFVSMEQVLDRKLTIHDFALNDPLLDLLHVLNNQNNTTQELKESLITIKEQSKRLENKSEELKRLSLVASTNENGVLFTKPDGTIFWCNEAYMKLTGFSKEDVIGKTPIEVGRTEFTDRESLRTMAELFFEGSIFDLEIVHAKKDGTYFWTRTKGQPIVDSFGNVTEYFAIIEDITLKKHYEESLKKEKEKYSSIIANMNLGLVEVDQNENIILANNSFCKMSGYTQEELIGRNAPKLLKIDAENKELNTRIENRKQGISDTYELNVINKNGEKRHLLISGAPNYGINGEVVGSIGIHLDITDQKKQEEQLYLLSLIAEKNLNGVLVCDKIGRIEWANSSFLEMTGYSLNELIGQYPGALLNGPETNPETLEYLKNCIIEGLPFSCEIKHYTKYGEKQWVSINGQSLYNKENEIIKSFAIIENITSRKELEELREELLESLAVSNKELEDYAHIVSHDLKSPLRSIHSLLSWIKEDNDKEFSPQTLSYFSMIENKVEKMDYLIEGILTYAKIDKIHITNEKIDSNEIIENIIQIIDIPENAQVVINNKLPIIRGDRFRVQQLFQNLISNAINHNDKAQCLIEIDCKESNENYIFTIKDNGPGISKEQQQGIFTIFQSYSKDEKSTGLGLSIVKKVVESYQGEIWIESELTKGTTFFIKLNK
ncbi:PAS domain S-box protein [Flavobacterium flavipallidum]|uniref:PAS domain S-box protein n=1 Tax=Flavobacterium flavipallidum TaxID=3139140 RepID=A0ABU9HL83_9FLAO